MLANHVYNAQLIGRPYLVDALEDVEIVTRRTASAWRGERVGERTRRSGSAVRAAAQVFNLTHVAAADAVTIEWADIVDQKRELYDPVSRVGRREPDARAANNPPLASA